MGMAALQWANALQSKERRSLQLQEGMAYLGHHFFQQLDMAAIKLVVASALRDDQAPTQGGSCLA